MKLVQHDWEQTNIARMRRLLVDTRESDRGFEWTYWFRQMHRQIRTFPAHLGPVRHVAFSPDGQLATAGDDSTARIWDLDTGEVLHELKHAGFDAIVRTADFSPSGDRILTSSGDGTARIWDAETGKEILVIQGHEAQLDEVPVVVVSPLAEAVALEVLVARLPDQDVARSGEGGGRGGGGCSSIHVPNGRLLLRVDSESFLETRMTCCHVWTSPR